MAIFIALIFQVLFVLFAMAINVALIVHDKINLQNAVDLAAYYAAQRQAEWLNVMAHQNYQIRQSWKLMAWRYRVLGTMGLDRPPDTHPTVPRGNGDAYDREEAIYPEGFASPGVCIGFFPIWVDAPNRENPCNEPNKYVPPFPVVPVIAPFNPINAAIRSLSIALRERFSTRCATIGAYNWWFANGILHAFRMDQKNRKEVIYAIADQLSRPNPNGDFIDLRGDSVLQGVQEVVRRNLTFGNFEGGPQIEMLNSLSGVPRQQWLAEVNVWPMLLYLDAAADAEGVGDCRTRKKLYTLEPDRPEARAVANQLDTEKALSMWSRDALFAPDTLYNLATGVEKNPWYMAYVGVKATTRSRQLFMPFGSPVTITAKAFAQPFGGRIGPWYSARWPRNSPRSAGAKIDELLPQRIEPGNFQTDNPDDPKRIPNYSRFPGDKLGLGSKLAQAAFNGQRNIRISYRFFRDMILDLDTSESKDIVAFNYDNPEDATYRNFELAAIAPDLFDITYYSIEPNFEGNYRAFLMRSRQGLGLPPNVPLRGDLGAREPELGNFTVEKQIEVSSPIRSQEAFFLVKEKAHLLTGWVNNASNYTDHATFPADRFGRCQKTDEGSTPKNPGSCILGGRSGYSVKLISRSLLGVSSQLDLGGTGEAKGAILNGPPEGW